MVDASYINLDLLVAIATCIVIVVLLRRNEAMHGVASGEISEQGPVSKKYLPRIYGFFQVRYSPRVQG